jgi:transcriptional regulator with XRE-family HTH domain
MMDSLTKQIGRRIRALRKQKGFTQARLARATLKTVETISKIENGHVSPSIGTLEEIARKLECPISAFFEDCELPTTETELTKAAQKIQYALSTFPDADLEVLAELVDALEKRRQ